MTEDQMEQLAQEFREHPLEVLEILGRAMLGASRFEDDAND